MIARTSLWFAESRHLHDPGAGGRQGGSGLIASGGGRDLILGDIAVWGLVMIRRGSGARRVVLVYTMLAPTSSSLAEVVVAVPLLLVALLPTAAAVTSRGLVGLRPLYSRMRTSGETAAALKLTVTVLPFAAALAMFLA